MILKTPIDLIELQIASLATVLSARHPVRNLMQRSTFPTFPEDPRATEDDQRIEKEIFVGETIHKVLDHLMHARKLLYLLGYRASNEEETQSNQ